MLRLPQRVYRDESGIAMALAVMVLVIVGVMGAGLLVFVRNDLESVVQVNQGQSAFDIADAGAQAAKQQLLIDAKRQHYDRDKTNDANPEVRLGDDWSPAGGGVSKKFAGGEFTVTIQCLEQTGDPTDSTDPCSGVTEEAPESVAASKKTFFKVISTGYYPNSGSGAKRKIESIFSTSDANVPQAYYTPGDIEFSGNVDISGVSFFSEGYIIGSRSGSVSIDRGPATPYGDWKTDYNDKPRSVDGAGFGAEKVICAGSQKPPSCDSVNDSAYGTYDFDSNSNPEFFRKANPSDPNDPGKISYPFIPGKSYNLDLLKSIAISQSGNSPGGNNFYSVNGSSTMVEHNAANGDIKYPDVSTSSSVVYINAHGNDITYSVNDSPKAEGIVVIENGNLKMGNSSNGFKGAFIVTGDGTATGKYTNSGKETLEGFVVADGAMKISGTTEPFVANQGFNRQPGNYNVNLWSWRELYQ